MQPKQVLEVALSRLQSVAPEQYRELDKAFATYAMDLSVAVTEATPDKIMTVQGRAQEARALMRIITEAPARNRRN